MKVDERVYGDDLKELDEKVVVSILEHTTRHGAIEGITQTKETKDKKRKIAAAKKADEDDLKELEEMEKRLLENKKGKGK